MKNIKTNIVAKLFSLFLVFALVTVNAQSLAQHSVKFPKGKSSAVVKGTLQADGTVDYVVSAKAGQTLKVTLKANSGRDYFNVLAPGSYDEAFYNGSINGNVYTGKVDQSGDYKIRVYNMRGTKPSSFTLNVSLTK